MSIHYTADGLLDFQDVIQKMNDVVNTEMQQKDYGTANDELMPIFFEMIRYFRGNYDKSLVNANPYWNFYFETLSDLMLNLAICNLHLGNEDNCVNFAVTSARIYTNGENYESRLEHSSEIVLYALTHKSELGLKVHPSETIREKTPEQFMDKAKLLYNTIVL